jgi:hypothetical protein
MTKNAKPCGPEGRDPDDPELNSLISHRTASGKEAPDEYNTPSVLDRRQPNQRSVTSGNDSC